MNSMFYGATNFNQDIRNWNISNVSDLGQMFADAVNFNQPIGDWDVSSVSDFWSAFRGATSFNQPLSSWNVSNATNMNNMFQDATSFNEDISSWCVSQFSSEPSNFATGSALIESHKPNWGNCPSPMVLHYDTALSSGTTVELPLFGNVDVVVDWGDESAPQSITTGGNHLHTYASEGQYTVRVSGAAEQLSVMTSLDYATKLTSVESFGTLGLTSLMNSFANASNLVAVPEHLPLTVTEAPGLFMNATSFNQDIGEWDVWWVTNMDNMFSGASSFNQDLSAWCVSHIQSEPSGFSVGSPLSTENMPVWGTCPDAMVLEFDTTVAMGSQISLQLRGSVDVWVDWGDGIREHTQTAGDIFKTYTTDGTYQVLVRGTLAQFGDATQASGIVRLVRAISFGDLGLTSLMGAFSHATNLVEVPDTLPSTVTSTQTMFSGATSFNQDISGWDVSNVTSMPWMFNNASSFNQDLSGWCVSQITELYQYSTFADGSAISGLPNWGAPCD